MREDSMEEPVEGCSRHRESKCKELGWEHVWHVWKTQNEAGVACGWSIATWEENHIDIGRELDRQEFRISFSIAVVQEENKWRPR